MAKLTKAQRRVLEYVREQGAVVLWPARVAPTRALHNRLKEAGLIRRVPAGSMRDGWAITAAGLAALDGQQKGGRAVSQSANMPDDAFQRVGEIARCAVREKVMAMLAPAEVSREAMQAVVLGALAGAVECFVCAADDGTSRERLKEALAGVVTDFVDQAKDQLFAGIQ